VRGNAEVVLRIDDETVAISMNREQLQASFAALVEYVGELEQDLRGKVDNYAALITAMNARAEVRKAEADRLYHRAKVDAGTLVGMTACLIFTAFLTAEFGADAFHVLRVETIPCVQASNHPLQPQS